MILPGRLADEPEADEFGPGSDLVLSMFAVVILMLGVVGVGRQWAAPLPPGHEAVPIGLRASLETQLANERARRIAAEAKLAGTAGAGGSSTIADVLANANEERRKFAAALDRERQRADENRAAAHRLAAVNTDLNERLMRHARGREVVLADEVGTRAAFVGETGRLSDAARRHLADLRRDLRDLFVGVDANVLMIEGRMSIEPRPRAQGRGDGALDLSAERSLSVAQALATDLEIPFDCISVEARGRSRSDMLFRRGSALPLPGHRLSDIDTFFFSGRAAGAESSVPLFRARFAEDMQRDRVVVARAEFDPGVPGCDATLLRRVLDQPK